MLVHRIWSVNDCAVVEYSQYNAATGVAILNYMRHVGLYSGTFNPIHKGHLAFAKETLTRCNLDHIALLPEPTPRYKDNVTDIAIRLQQIESAISKQPRLSVHMLESQQFSIDETLPEIKIMFPDMRFTLLIGSDVALNLKHWLNLETLLLNDIGFAIGIRSEHSIENIRQSLSWLTQDPQYPVSIAFVSTEFSHISSSQLRIANS